MRILVTVQPSAATRSDPYGFSALIRQSMNPAGLFLSPEGFYGKFGRVPDGLNFELELVGTCGIDPKILHTHVSEKNGRPFMCYPHPIPSLERALELFEIWCLGAVMTLNHGVDMNTVFTQECGGDEAKFREMVARRYGLSVARSLTVS